MIGYRPVRYSLAWKVWKWTYDPDSEKAFTSWQQIIYRVWREDDAGHPVRYMPSRR